MSDAFYWQCPVCSEALTLTQRTWRCVNGHCFDCAKEGYVNLLLAQHKNSKAPGDNKDMVQARQGFLATHGYQPLALKIAELARKHLSSNCTDSLESDEPLLFDVGCSEGYYSAQIQNALKTSDINLQVAGLDIAKPAIQKAAKVHKQNHYCVASSYNIPLADNSVDIALQVFAPASSDEIQRVLKHKGMWFLIEPAPKHLQELKAFVYKNVQHHEVSAELAQDFVLEEVVELSFECSLESAEQRLNLLKMTPYYWRISPDNKEKLLLELEMVNAAFVIKCMRPQ